MYDVILNNNSINNIFTSLKDTKTPHSKYLMQSQLSSPVKLSRWRGEANLATNALFGKIALTNGAK